MDCVGKSSVDADIVPVKEVVRIKVKVLAHVQIYLSFAVVSGINRCVDFPSNVCVVFGKMVYMEKGSVDVVFDDIADIMYGKENLHIKVRVVRLWKVPSFLNPSEFTSVEMVLVDEKELGVNCIELMSCYEFNELEYYSYNAVQGDYRSDFNHSYPFICIIAIFIH
ncbi:hypothetical protein TSUD_355510 [Trifolium subterraneum]|uniref:DUF223 domain-containing protein n=1 Tax=Trifolium subterraneum TaxID=3900 RepID=A0A2Z6MH25_TRISU|nr:hypothetical protein TSUD_355510 [Trifolium subterraneum]